jgi:hypothetical protein
MNISAPFIRRPVATSLLSMGFLLFGGLAFRSLPMARLPEVEYPTITVFAVAQKLAVLLHKLWVNAEVYEPLRNHPTTA